MNLRVLTYFTGAIILFSFVSINIKNIDPDLGWHLKVGEWILQNKSIPAQDIYSYTMPGFEWVDHEWLIQPLLWFFYSKNIWWLAILIFSLLAFFPVFVWLKRRESAADLWFIAIISILLAGFIGVRPHIISFVLFFAVFELLFSRYYLKTPLSDRLLFVLPIIFLLWANLHAGFFSGLLVFAVFTASQFWGHRPVRYTLSNGTMSKSPPSLLLLILFLLSTAATLINPYGWKIYREIFKVAVFSDVSKYIMEWQPAFSRLENWNDLILPIFLGIFGFLVFKFRKQYPAVLLFTSLTFAAMYLKSVKIGPFFLVSAVPILIIGRRLISSDLVSLRNAGLLSPLTGGAFKIMHLAILLSSLGFLVYITGSYRSLDYPFKAAVFLEDYLETRAGVNILNEYGWGGYLMFRLPQMKLFIDGRMPHWVDKDGNSAMNDYVKVFYNNKDKDAWKEVFERRNINLALIKNTPTPPELKKSWFFGYLSKPVARYFEKRKNNPILKKVLNIFNAERGRNLNEILLANGWRSIYEDEIAVILTPL